MNSSSASHTARPSARSAATVLAAAGILCALTLAGCAPEPEEQGAPTTTAQEPAAPSGTAAPSEAGDDAQVDDDGAPSGAPDAGRAPDDTDRADADPVDADDDTADERGGTDEDQSAADTGVNGTDDWREPEDPTAEGPTAAPALPEVNGRIGDGVSLPSEVVVSLTSISTTTLTAETPGEQSGPAVVVEVQVTNESEVPQPVGSATVSLSVEGGEIGVPTWASPNDPLQGEVPVGATAVGTYVFMLDPADDRSVTVRVSYSAGEPVATFTGTTP